MAQFYIFRNQVILLCNLFLPLTKLRQTVIKFSLAAICKLSKPKLSRKNGVVRTGLCAGWEIEFRLPGTAAD